MDSKYISGKNIEIEILYEDAFLLALNKPAGLVVNDSVTQKNNVTLQAIIRDNISTLNPTLAIVRKSYDQNNLSNRMLDFGEKWDYVSRLGIVHRLDAATSGILLVAKSYDAFRSLQAMFKDRRIKKGYDALVYGTLHNHECDDPAVPSLTIDAPIGRNPRARHRFIVKYDGKPSVTRVKVLETFQKDTGYTLLKCLPVTGRTHQLRVHLSALSHPVVGDVIYAGKQQIKRHESEFDRMFLHASNIQFNHPITGKGLRIDSELPRVMIDFLSFIKTID